MKRSTVISFLVAVLGFGILVPWWKGFEFLDATILLASACVSLVFVAPMTAASFNGEHAHSQMLTAVGSAWMIALLILVSGIATVNIKNWLGQLLMPHGGILFSALLLNVCAGFFLALTTVEGALRTGKPETGVRLVRMAFFLLLAVLVFLARFASPSMRSMFDESMTSEGLIRMVLVISGILGIFDLLLLKRVDGQLKRVQK